MQKERNCGGEFLTIEEKEKEFPPHHLGGTYFEWECPTSAIPAYITSVIELFFLCYVRIPGLNGWYMQRQALPTRDAPLEQDHWTMAAFSYLESCFMEWEDEQSNDRKQAAQAAATSKHVENRYGQ